MKIIISPAKSLDVQTPYFEELNTTLPFFIKDAEQLMTALKKQSPTDLKKLMKLSDNLANLNWERNQNWTVDDHQKKGRAAIFTFTGDVYKGLDVQSLSVEKVRVLQEKLRILSGLYGVLKPLDKILPYRLEMGTKFGVDTANLYDFWGAKIRENFNDNKTIINLASEEYFKAVALKKITARVITPVFREYKNGTLKTIGIFAKKARGTMVRYIIENDIETPEKIKKFDGLGYGFDSNLSTENQWVFTR